MSMQLVSILNHLVHAHKHSQNLQALLFLSLFSDGARFPFLLHSQFRDWSSPVGNFSQAFSESFPQVWNSGCSSDLRAEQSYQHSASSSWLCEANSRPLINSSYAISQRQPRCLSGQLNGDYLHPRALIRLCYRDVRLREDRVKNVWVNRRRMDSLGLQEAAADPYAFCCVHLMCQQWISDSGSASLSQGCYDSLVIIRIWITNWFCSSICKHSDWRSATTI